MTSRILISLRVPGPPAGAFQAFTEQISTWWQPNPLFGFTPHGSGRVAFIPPAAGTLGRFVELQPDGTIFLIGEVTIWDPGNRLVFGWRQANFTSAQHTEVEVTFEPAGDETRVTVQHRGWDSLPPAHAALHGMVLLLFSRRHGDWWQKQLSLLADQLQARPGALPLDPGKG